MSLHSIGLSSHPAAPQLIAPHNTIGASLNKLTKDEQNWLINVLADSPRWRTLATELSRYSDKIDCNLIDGIESSSNSSIDQAKAFLTNIKNIPEISPELFIEVLKNVQLYAIAVELAQKIGLKAPAEASRKRNVASMNQTAAKISRVGFAIIRPKEPKPLDEEFWQFLNKRPTLREKLVYEISSIYKSDEHNWTRILQNCIKMEFARFPANLIGRIESSSQNLLDRGRAFLSHFKQLPDVTLGKFLKALAATSDTYETVALEILEEAGCPDSFDDLPFPCTIGQEPNRPVAQVIQAKGKSIDKLDEQLKKFLNNRMDLYDQIKEALSGIYGQNHRWPRLLQHLLQQPTFKGKFAPNPTEWCKSVTKDSRSDYDASGRILDNISGMLRLTVRAFVTALASSGECFEELVQEICEKAEAPDFPQDLAASQNVPDPLPAAAPERELSAARIALLETEKIKAELAAAKKALEEIRRVAPAAAEKPKPKDEENNECAICFGPREAVVLTCGDAKFCMNCVKDLTTCPICCRQDVTYTKIYY